MDPDDWTYEVLEGSHKHFEEFMDTTRQWRCTKMEDKYVSWFAERGCHPQRLTLPKGGLFLFDTRLFQADVRPKRGRAHPARWRLMLQVCMTPASWATDKDLATKRRAYDKMETTTWQPSQKVEIYVCDSRGPADPYPDFQMPEVARTDEALKLAGVKPYDGNEADTDLCPPSWNEDKWGEQIDEWNESRLAINMTTQLKKLTGDEL